MKRGRVTVAAIWVACPHCDEDVSNPTDGSFLWTLDQVETKPTVECDCCGKAITVYIPKKVNR
jgi:transcription elongation factor Elf1